MLTRRGVCATALAGAAATVLCPTVGEAAPSSRRLSSKSARNVSRFLNSVAVGAHWTYSDTPYGYAYERVRDALVASGIRHVRSELFSDRLVDLAERGVHSTVNVGPENGPLEGVVRRIKELNAGRRTVVAVEGPNEPDLFWPRQNITYKGQGYPAGAKAFAQDLYAALKADPATAGLPVIGISFGTTFDPGGGRPHPFAEGELTSTADWGNFHPYPGGNPFSYPAPYAGINRYYWESDFPSGKMGEYPYAFDVYAPPFAPKPMAATETGYSTTMDGTSEEVHAIYIPRLFCEYFRRRVERTYLYELVDEFDDPDGLDREAHFGLIRRDLTPKPAYTALQSLLKLLRLAPPGGGHQLATPVDIELSISPNGIFTRTDYVHQLFLRAGDGSFYLLLWHEVAAQDVAKKPYRRIKPAALRTQVTFSRPCTVRRYEYDPQWRLRQSLAEQRTESLSIDVGERVCVLALR